MTTEQLAERVEALEGLRATCADVFGSMIYIFECSDDEQASRVAKEAADKLETALRALASQQENG